MSPPPLIGIPCELAKHTEFPVKDKNVLDAVYSEAVLRAGGTPVIIPISTDRGGPADLFDRLDGIMLPGGDDIPPSRYGQQPHPTLKPMPESQFESWTAWLELALEGGKPLLAVCAGIQVVNVALGGSLIQDIPSQTHSPVCHHSRTPARDAVHSIDVAPGSRLAAILGRTQVTVNSAHHQALDRVADGLTITARCSGDGIIEAAEIPDHRFLIAVQWHPERDADGDTDRRLFAAFLDACHDAHQE